MKLTSSKLSANSFVLNFAICLSIYFISACGGGDGGDSWETGSVAFNLQVEDPAQASMNHQILQAEFPCEERQIVSISAKVFDEDAQEFDDNDTPLSAGGPWPCETGEGGISGVLAGIDRTLVVDAKDSFDVTIYRGIKAGIPIRANQTTDAGTVILESVTNRAPVMDPIDDQQAREGELLSFFVTATDVDGDSLTFSADLSQLPDASNPAFDPDTQEFSWTPDFVDAGNYVAVFRVTDDGSPPATDSQEVNIEVVNDNRPPVLDPIGPQTGFEGQLLEFTITATDEDAGDVLSFSANNLPTGATLTDNGDRTATFSWRPTYPDSFNSPFLVTFNVFDNGSPGGIDFEEVTITVL